jgi:GTP cyclohydrolase I
MTSSPDDGDLVRGSPKVAVPDEVAEAVRTLIRWAGDDPAREGLADTPLRVARYCVEVRMGQCVHCPQQPAGAPAGATGLKVAVLVAVS